MCSCLTMTGGVRGAGLIFSWEIDLLREGFSVDLAFLLEGYLGMEDLPGDLACLLNADLYR